VGQPRAVFPKILGSIPNHRRQLLVELIPFFANAEASLPKQLGFLLGQLHLEIIGQQDDEITTTLELQGPSAHGSPAGWLPAPPPRHPGVHRPRIIDWILRGGRKALLQSEGRTDQETRARALFPKDHEQEPGRFAIAGGDIVPARQRSGDLPGDLVE